VALLAQQGKIAPGLLQGVQAVFEVCPELLHQGCQARVRHMAAQHLDSRRSKVGGGRNAAGLQRLRRQRGGTKALLQGRGAFPSVRARVSHSVASTMGLATSPFMPTSWQWRRSSGRVCAVMASTGIWR
jgi:hypothetical protein